MTAAIVSVYLHLFLRNCLRNSRKDVEDEALTRDPTVFNAFFLEKPSEYPQPYVARN